MALQNRVDPWGVLHAVSARGTMMGNRGGKFHRDDQTLGKRRWASHHWICCDLHYRQAHHEAMGEGYTSLFFLDEVTALAAGHRPCFYCRRAEAKAFLGDEKVEAFDRRVHAERLAQAASSRHAAHDTLSAEGEGRNVDGVMIEVDGVAFAVKAGQFLRWSFNGYAAPEAMGPISRILTPPSIVAILARGYKPRWHPSATKGEAT